MKGALHTIFLSAVFAAVAGQRSSFGLNQPCCIPGERFSLTYGSGVNGLADQPKIRPPADYVACPAEVVDITVRRKPDDRSPPLK